MVHYHNSSLPLKLSSNLELLVNQFNNATPENSKDSAKYFSSKYYDTEEMNNTEIPHKNNKITKQVSLSNHLNLNHYSFEFTPVEYLAGGTLLYIANHLSYKCLNDLNICTKLNWNLLLLNLSTQENKYYCGSYLQTSIYGLYWIQLQLLKQTIGEYL